MAEVEIKEREEKQGENQKEVETPASKGYYYIWLDAFTKHKLHKLNQVI